jgi:putative transposase
LRAGVPGIVRRPQPAMPQAVVQTCIVHLIRNSRAFVSWKDRKAMLPAIKAIYRAENARNGTPSARGVRGRVGRTLPAIARPRQVHGMTR